MSMKMSTKTMKTMKKDFIVRRSITIVDGKPHVETYSEQELIRCKDCKYAHLTYSGECKYCDKDADENGFTPVRYRPGDWYCADGAKDINVPTNDGR